MRSFKTIVLSALLITLLIPSGSASAGPAASERPDGSSLLKLRRAFKSKIDRYLRVMDRSARQTYYLKVANPTNSAITVRPSEMFYSVQRIREEAGIRPADPARVKTGKIYEFLKKHWKHSVPLFESKMLHETPYFMSVYGSGFCDDAASTFIYLLGLEGVESRGRWLEGHVVAEARYDDSWHAYDIDRLGTYERDGRVTSFDEWVEMAKEGRFSVYNEVISDTKNHVIKLPERLFFIKKMGDPEIMAYAGEERVYYKDLWSLTLQGSYFETEMLSDPDRLFGRYPQMANFTRTIPLKNIVRKDGTLEISDYFPFTDVFIMTKAELGRGRGPIPFVAVNYDRPSVPAWIPMEDTGMKVEGQSVWSGSAAVGNLGMDPSHRLGLGNLSGLLRLDPNASLRTVHYYAAKNMRYDPAAVQDLERSGLTVRYS